MQVLAIKTKYLASLNLTDIVNKVVYINVVGTISAVGKGVSNLKVGQRVGLGWHSGYCMTCPTCMSGDHNMCAHAEGTIVNRHGGFADKVRAQADSVVALPQKIDIQSAGLYFGLSGWQSCQHCQDA